MNQPSRPRGHAPAAPIDLSRRGFLTRLAALPAALGIAGIIAGAGAAEGKKTSKKRNKRGGKKKGNGGNGGGGYSPDAEERKFLDLINAYRRQNNAGNLSLQNQLGAAADSHSRDMAKKNYFRHSNTGKLVEQHGYKGWKAIGENIAAGQETAKQVFDDWKKSSGHDKNMRSKDFTEIGIGRAYNKGSKYGWYWTTTFGDR